MGRHNTGAAIWTIIHAAPMHCALVLTWTRRTVWAPFQANIGVEVAAIPRTARLFRCIWQASNNQSSKQVIRFGHSKAALPRYIGLYFGCHGVSALE